MNNLDQPYAAAASPQIRLHAVESPDLLALNRAIRDVERAAQGEGTAEIIRTYLSAAKSARFVLAATPVAGSSPSLRLAALAARARASEDELKWRVSATVYAKFKAIPPCLEKLSFEEKSPLAIKFKEILEQDGHSSSNGLVFPDSAALRHAEPWARERGYESLLTPAALRGADFYERLYFFGSPRWLIRAAGDFLFATPRCAQMDVIGYRWSDLSVRANPVFVRTTARKAQEEAQGKTPLVINAPAGSVGEGSGSPTVTDDPDAFELPAIDVQAWLRSRPTNQRLPGFEEGDDEIEARLIMLAGAYSVFLPFADDAKSFVAYLDDRGSARFQDGGEEEEELASVRRVFNRDLEEGDFILLRTEASGDIVPVVADNLMGPVVTAQRRGDQKRWKSALRERLTTLGSEQLCDELKQNGAIRATQTNVRNWMHGRSIRPAADEDLRAILRTVGLGGDEIRYFETAAFLLGMHHSAGSQVKRMLISEVRKADHSALRKSGFMTFRLEGVAAGATMTVYRIERIVPDVVTARFSQVNVVFEQKDTGWQ
jgi:hypothetical protein